MQPTCIWPAVCFPQSPNSKNERFMLSEKKPEYSLLNSNEEITLLTGGSLVNFLGYLIAPLGQHIKFIIVVPKMF